MLRTRSPGASGRRSANSIAPFARDLAAQNRPGAERRDDPAQPFDAGVDPHVGRVAQRSVDRDRPQPVPRADDGRTDLVHAPAPGREFEPQLTPLAAREPERDRRRVAVEPRGGRHVDVDTRAATTVLDGEHRAEPISLERAVAVEHQIALERERLVGERDRDEQRERRRQDRELRASRDQGRHQRRRREPRVEAQPG
jgi:hypothetical protein